MKAKITTALAVMVSVVCAAMAAAAAADRATTTTDQVMLTAAAVALALGSHLIPALAPKSWLAKVLFIGCVLATVYNHAHYFDAQHHRSGSDRAEAVPTSNAAVALQSELSANTARPLPAVASDLAQATAKAAQAAANLARCESKCTGFEAADQSAKAKVLALTDERQSAIRAQQLREQLAALAADSDSAKAKAAQNPVDVAIADITGIDQSRIGFIANIGQSLMLEVMAALLWSLSINKQKAQEDEQQKPSQAVELQIDAQPIASPQDVATKPATKPRARRQARKPRDSPKSTQQY